MDIFFAYFFIRTEDLGLFLSFNKLRMKSAIFELALLTMIWIKYALPMRLELLVFFIELVKKCSLISLRNWLCLFGLTDANRACFLMHRKLLT